jgi:hypothetical protein
MRSANIRVGSELINLTESSSHAHPGQVGWVMAQDAYHSSVSVDVDSDDPQSIASRYARLSAAVFARMGVRLTAAKIEEVLQERAPTVGED